MNKQDELMRYDPATLEYNPYPSHAEQWRIYHGKTAWIYNPWTGRPRSACDIGSDTFGLLIEATRPNNPVIEGEI
ncbi:MAG: hypothetical protein GY776_12320 [Alteromonas sp.]|nr:hypothetical protein [Alteromonas sp.]